MERGPDRHYCYPYPHPAVATDIAVFTLQNEALKLLLIQRGADPLRGSWALPGGFLKSDEDLDSCARRELEEESNVAIPVLKQFGVFSAPNRDPRERVISVAYLALIPSDRVVLRAATDAMNAKWYTLDKLPALAFDHDKIIEDAIRELRELLTRSFELLFGLLSDPNRFTLRDLQTIYEAVMGTPIDKSTFRKRVLAEGSVRPIGKRKEEGVSHRPALLYKRVWARG